MTKMTKNEKDLLNLEKKCMICMERLVDAIMSPCHHGGVCFECAKTALDNRNSCYYCRDVLIVSFRMCSKYTKSNLHPT